MSGSAVWCVELHANLISAQVAVTTLAGMSYFSISQRDSELHTTKSVDQNQSSL